MNHKQTGSSFLQLEDGTIFHGTTPFEGTTCLGEVVFNTSHTGYQEILTDPSYYRQIVVFTAPHIGNVGINKEDYESEKVQVAGVVVRALVNKPRNWRAESDLGSWLKNAGVPVITGVDTRAVTLHIREYGAMRAGIFSGKTTESEALKQVKESPEMAGSDLATIVSCSTKYAFSTSELVERWHPTFENGDGLHVAVLDFGVKSSILRELVSRGCKVTVLPATTEANDIIASEFDGVLVSNGPGDPAAVKRGIETVKSLLVSKMPMFGICLGHQLIALAAGLKTFKLPFGHRGANHPVQRLKDKTVEISSQNHGFAVQSECISKDWCVTHLNLNDGTVEGLEHTSQSVFTIQYHPEANPGPHDGQFYFDRFISEMRHA